MTGLVERSAVGGQAGQDGPSRAFRTAGGALSFRFRPRAVIVCVALLVVLAAVSVVAIGTGDYPIAPAEVVRTIFGYGDQSTSFIVMTLRMPRVLTAILVGAALAVSGAIFQSLSRNPLGSPDIIGFTTGAATGAVVAILVFRSGALQIAVCAVLGGIATALAVYLLAFRRGVQGYRLVLVGIGVSAMLTSVNSYLLTRADLEEAIGAQVWLTGSLNGRGWSHVGPVALALLVLLPAVAAYARRLTLLEMGDDAAKSLGIPVERTRLVLVVIAVALCAVAVASAGPVGFIALAAPQLASRLTRSPGVGLASAAVMGAVLLTVSDFAAQRLLAPTQLPVGVMTGAVGGVYLAWLLAKGWRRGQG